MPKFYGQHREDRILANFFKKNTGFYVDVGAASGIKLSNTYHFELLGWDGICVEPYQPFFKQLRRNRNAIVVFGAAYDQTGKVVLYGHEKGFISTTEIDDAVKMRRKTRRGCGTDKSEYNGRVVPSFRIADILDEHNAPNNIDLFSLDVEGGEFKVLDGHDFDKYDVRVFVIEANTTSQREQLNSRMSEHGYECALVHKCNCFYSKHNDVLGLRNSK